MIFKQITAGTFVGLLSVGAFGQEIADAKQRLFFQSINKTSNIASGFDSPVVSAYNTIKTVGTAQAGYMHQSGDFTAIDAAKSANQYTVQLEGLKHFSEFNLEGGIIYDNIAEKKQAWNSGLYLSPNNPFILANDQAGDRSIEQFKLYAGFSTQVKKWTLGLRADYLTGALSDEFDPRAKTHAMRFAMQAGTLYQITSQLSVGLSAKAGWYNSQTSHTTVNNLAPDGVFYLLKGLGNWDKRTASDHENYPREYTGNMYGAAIQFLCGNAASLRANALQIDYTTNKEISLDGSRNLIYRSGDYFSDRMGVSNTFYWGRHSRWRHQVAVKGVFETGAGYWYDQKKEVDTAHGNINYYKILSKYKINSAHNVHAVLAYDLTIMQQAIPAYQFSVRSHYTRHHVTQNDGEIYEEMFDHVCLELQVRKNFLFAHFQIAPVVMARFVQNVGDPLLQAKHTEISETYTSPRFGYLSAERYAIEAGIDMTIPVVGKKQTYFTGLRFYYDYEQMFGENSCQDLGMPSRSQYNLNIYLNF